MQLRRAGGAAACSEGQRKPGRRRWSEGQPQIHCFERRCRDEASRDRSGPPSARHHRALFPGFPIVDLLDPIIDRVVFRMLRHQFCFAADFREHLRIAQIGYPELHPPQPLRARALAARRHALLRGAGLWLFAGRGHGQNVGCYTRERNVVLVVRWCLVQPRFYMTAGAAPIRAAARGATRCCGALPFWRWRPWET